MVRLPAENTDINDAAIEPLLKLLEAVLFENLDLNARILVIEFSQQARYQYKGRRWKAADSHRTLLKTVD